MITSLSINNFALIEKLSIDFSQGFSIITGETGAGKSILLGALGLVLGKRADLASLKNKEEKCVIEAQFDLSHYNLQSFFETNDLDYEDHTIIRREILPSGKSRAFVNDTPVNLQELQELGDFLIDIHSQHQTQELSDDGYQFAIIDAIAGNKALLSDYSDLLKSYKKDKSQLGELNSQLHDIVKEQDYNNFLLEELLSANLKPSEQQELEAVYEQLSNVELIRENLDKSLAIAHDEQFGVTQNLREMKTALQKIAGFSADFQSLSERLNSAAIELEDIVSELNRLTDKLVQDPQQLELVNQKLQSIYNLQKKHNVATVEELLEIQNELDNKAVSVTTLESDIQSLENQIQSAQNALDEKAVIIRKNREEAVPVLTQRWAEILSQLGMPNVRFQIEIKPGGNYLPNGKDELQFLFSANKGSDFGLLKKVASGGEMSRIMLATKSILAQYSKLPTIVFDEIDTGVSGEIADKMGEIMKAMSKQMQVFAITHLPQIAAKGNDHFRVFKTTEGNQTATQLKRLDHEERVVEIAQMLSGAAISDSAINHAKALLN
ncbi:DNA repair protein RecN [Flavobacterium sp.]|uniref:DNA repair protein RecN n=1 Tax=Flavobacterium sp. TaxID=239 RepID=UPI0039E5B50B